MLALIRTRDYSVCVASRYFNTNRRSLMQLRTLRCSPFSFILGAAWRNYALSKPALIHARLNASTGEYLQASCRLLLTDNKRQDSHIITYINILSDAPAKAVLT